jgi:hypothetical protein
MCCHLKDVKHVLTLRALSNLSSVSEIELPEPGTILFVHLVHQPVGDISSSAGCSKADCVEDGHCR